MLYASIVLIASERLCLIISACNVLASSDWQCLIIFAYSVLSTNVCQCLISLITLCHIAHLYLLRVTVRCDRCRTTVLVLISTETRGDRWTHKCQCERVTCSFTGGWTFASI